jgi:hypothetical protein
MSPIALCNPARVSASFILRSVAVLAGLAASTAPAHAEFITQFAGLNYGQSPAGSYKWYQTNTQYANNDPAIDYVEYKPADSQGHHFLTFCIQRNVTMEPNPHEFNVVDLEQAPDASHMSTGTANKIRTMWGNWRSDLDVGTDSVKNKKHSAFAHAIWYLLGQFENGDNTPDGDGLSNSTKTYYLQYLNELLWDGTKKANLKALVGRYGHYKDDQDQIIEYDPPPGNDNVVPAPAALVLALTGIGPCLFLRRRVFGRKAS